VLVGANDGTVTTHLTAFDINVVGDLDGDSLADDVDSDIDGDGIDNDFETANGLDPRDSSDANGDLDGDGVSNLDEFTAGSDPTADDYPPAVTAPEDITVEATGLFTEVDLGTPSADDTLDGELTASADRDNNFAPGVHTVTWTATDAAGNSASDTQTVNVIPLVEFSKDQTADEGATVTVRVLLNGSAVSYPVIVPYVVSGDATQPGDFTLADGSVEITSGTETSFSFTTVDDGDNGEPIKHIEITMGAPTNAVVGPHDVHVITMIETNIAPRVALQANQSNKRVTTVAVDAGEVVIHALVNDPNPSDTHAFDWSLSNNSLIDQDGVDDSFTIDPSTLLPGLYTLHVAVSDSGLPPKRGEAKLLLNVVATAPVLSSTTDSDNDGIMDADEGSGDSDGDGVADFADAIATPNVLQEIAGTSDGYLIESEPGVRIQLGVVAFAGGKNAAEVNHSDIGSQTGISKDDVTNIGGIFDFKVEDLPQEGQSVQVVIPQLEAIPGDAVYRKLIANGWQDFVEDEKNRLASAPGRPGYCPPPGSDQYQSGLVENYWCVQLTIEDGGPNDGDGETNNAIEDPGGVAKRLEIHATIKSSGGGAFNPLWLVIGLLYLGVMANNRRKEAGK
jgi:hypothetical protein